MIFFNRFLKAEVFKERFLSKPSVIFLFSLWFQKPVRFCSLLISKSPLMLRISLREILFILCSIFFSLRDSLSRDNWASASRTSNLVPIPASNFAIAWSKLVVDKLTVNFLFWISWYDFLYLWYLILDSWIKSFFLIS